MPDPAVLLDRDGVINVRRPDHVKSWAAFRFAPGSLCALGRLATMGERVVVITNQSAVGRGLLTAAGLASIHVLMTHVVARAGGRIDRVYACPHRPDSGCGCRKPAIGLLLLAAAELDIDLRRSVLVGDSATDVQAALAAGCQPIFVGEPEGDLLLRGVPSAPDLLSALPLVEAVRRSAVPC